MKTLLAICMIVAAPSLCANAVAAPGAPLKGEVVEVKEVSSYTYLRLKTRDGEKWAAVGKAPVRKGAQVTIENTMVMVDFESPSLKQKFPEITFGTLAGTGGAAMAGHMPMGHSGKTASVDLDTIKVAKAVGANAYTVAEIQSGKAALKDKPVLLRAKVVKFNGGIMGKNWLHVRDGSGSAEAGSNDILVTSQDQALVGDVVTVTGIVRTDKDFGSGYAYKVLIEEARLAR
jgi:hypothetical protein